MKKIWIILFSVMVCICLIAPALAIEEGASTTCTPSSTELLAGDEVKVVVSLSDCVPIRSMGLELSYDSDIFELVSAKWTVSGAIIANYDAARRTAALAFVSATDINGDIFEFVLKVKDSASLGETEIGLSQVPVKDASMNDVTCTAGSVTVSINCGHTEKTEVPAKSPDCIHSGNYLYYVCNSCGAVLKADGVTKTTVEAETIPADGHDWKAATCTEPKTCKTCGETEGDPLGHSFTNYTSDHNATCTEDGTKTAKCDRCEVTDTIPDVGSVNGHDWKAATCTEPKTCKTCGETEGDPLGHSFTNYTSDHNATCTEDGTKTAKCDRCEVTDTIPDAGSVKGHDWKAATCTEPKTCKTCGETEGDPLGHSFTNYTSDHNATCTEDGTKTAKCDRCDVTHTITDAGSAKGHHYADIWSANEDGHWHECTDCGDQKDFESHDFGDEGDKCLVCDYERGHVHRLTLVPAKEPTETEAGNKAYYICSGCGEWYEDAAGTKIISDHSSVIIPATPDMPPETGEQTRCILWTILITSAVFGLVIVVFGDRKIRFRG